MHVADYEEAVAAEQPVSATSRDDRAPAPIEDLIDALETDRLECMDDRMSQSSGEAFDIVDGDGFVIVDRDAKGQLQHCCP